MKQYAQSILSSSDYNEMRRNFDGQIPILFKNITMDEQV